jgi:phospholipid transport system substrate-binding protein
MGRLNGGAGVMFRGRFARFWLFVLIAGGLGAAVAGPSAVRAQDASPTAVIERFHATLIDAMKKGKELGFEGRRAMLEPVVKDTFDLESMARISTGGAWAKMSDADHAGIIAAFTDWTIASYAGNFNAYDGETFVTKDQTPEDSKGNVLVNTRLNPKGMPPVLFNYRMQKVGTAWKVYDIYLDGAVSQLAMHRAEFATVLGLGKPADLIAHMKKLTKDAEKGGA